MIHGLDGAPVVVLEGRVAAMLVRPLERLVADARRRREPVDPAVLAALTDFERVRRLLVAARVPPTVPVPEPAEPDSKVADLEVAHETDTTLSTADAARFVGVSPSYLRRLARQRRLAVKVGNGWRFYPGELAILMGDRPLGSEPESRGDSAPGSEPEPGVSSQRTEAVRS